jgi:DNA-binding response OmpR family regulator
MDPWRKLKVAWYVDDDQEMINAITLLMQLLDYEVRPFLNAPDAARELIAGERPDLLLLDINMPQVSGIDMLEFIRRKEEFNYLPVVIISTEAADRQIHEAIDKGADTYVLKPVTIEELENAIKKSLRNRKNKSD